MAALQVRRLGYALGAEVRGVDLSRPLDDITVANLQRAWLDHLLLCFPDQHLRKEDLVAFASRFGDELDDNRNTKTRDPENTNIVLMTNKPVAGKPWDGYKAGQNWHSDRSYSDRPMTGTFLYAKEIPDVGGDTIFSNQYMAYETLSPAMRGIIERLSSVHDATRAKNFEQQGADVLAARRRDHPPIVHPVVKVHSETRRKALYIGDRVSQFEGMSEDESQPLLDFLNQHSVSYEFTYRHRWHVNDLIMWDNRCLIHIAPSDYDQQRQPRHMWRCSLFGPKSGHFYTPNNAPNSEKTQDEIVAAGS